MVSFLETPVSSLTHVPGKAAEPEANSSQEHPFHLHGHDFYILAQVPMATFSDSSALNLSNPPRRDVAMLPASGYLAIAFQNDNPGVWLAHCHVSSPPFPFPFPFPS